MGLPAIKREPAAAVRRPHLLVLGPDTTAPKHRGTPARQSAHAAAYQSFVFFAIVVGVVATLGVGRVWLSVQAAEASIDCGRLQTEIKAARYEGDMLQIQASALSSPSRIQSVAQGQLGMAPATSVSYMRISPDGGTKVALVDTPPPARTTPPVLNSLVSVAAAEARMLLVGDVGLASSR